MENIIIKYTFELENGLTQVMTIRDIRSDITTAEITALAAKLIAKSAESKGSKFKAMKKCEKIITSTEIIEG